MFISFQMVQVIFVAKILLKNFTLFAVIYAINITH